MNIGICVCAVYPYRLAGLAKEVVLFLSRKAAIHGHFRKGFTVCYPA